MEEDIIDYSELYANSTYEEENKFKFEDTIGVMLSQGADPRVLEEEYPLFKVNMIPTFKTSPSENQELNRMLLVRDYILDPNLRESKPHQEAYSYFMGRQQAEALKTSSFIAKGAVGLGSKVFGDDFLFEDRQMNPDELKAYEWVKDIQRVYEPDQAKMMKTGTGALKVAGFIADTVVLNKAIGGDMNTLTKAVRAKDATIADSIIGKAVAKQFIKYSDDAKNLDRFLRGAKITGQVAEDFAMGGAFVLRDIMIDDRPENQEFKETTKELAKEFGTGVAVDFAVNGLMNVILPGSKNLGRIFFQKGKKGINKITIEEATDLANDALNMRLDPDSLSKLRRNNLGEMADRLEDIQTQRSSLQTLKEQGKDGEATLKMLANNYNMDFKEIEGGYEVVRNTLEKGRKKIVQVKTLDEVAAEIDDKMLKGFVKSQDEIYKTASLTKGLKVTQEFEGTIKSTKADLDLENFSESVIPRTGSFNRYNKDDALNYVKTSIRKLGDEVPETLDNIKVKLSDDFFKKMPSIESETLELPRLISNGIEQKRYIKYLGDFIDFHGNNINKAQLDEVLQTLGDFTGKWSFKDMDWIQAQASKLDMKIIPREGKYILDDGVEIKVFDNEDLLGNHIYSKSIDEKTYNDYLAVEKGYTLKKDPETNFIGVYNQFKNRVALGRNIEEIMANNPMLRPEYPLETGPKIAFLTDSGRDVRFNGNYIEGSVSQINDYMKRYKSLKNISNIFDTKSTKMVQTKSGHRVAINNLKKRWVVTSDATGMKPKRFKSEKALKKFLADVGTPEKALLNTAREKGVEITATRAGYVIQKVGEANQFTRTYDETLSKIRAMSNQAEMPEVFERTQHLIDEAEEIFDDSFDNVNFGNHSTDQNEAILKKVFADMNEEYSTKLKGQVRTGLSKAASNLFSVFRDGRGKIQSLLKGSPERIPVMSSFDNLIQVDKQMKTVQSNFHEAVKGFSKNISKDRRELLGTLLSKELKETEWDEAFANIPGEVLTETDKEFMRGVRSIFDQAGQMNGFGDTLDTIQNYFPRMATLSMADILSPNENAVSLAKKAFGRELAPAELKFFQNMRNVEIAGYALEKDPLALMQRYVDDTLKANLIEPAVENLVETAQRVIDDPEDLEKVLDVARTARGFNDDRVTKYVKKLNDELTTSYYQKVAKASKEGVHKMKHSFSPVEFVKGKTEQISEETIEQMNDFQKEKLRSALSQHKFRQNPLNQIMGVVTLSTQAFKPWLPIRNTFQPETHLAPIFGFGAVAKAKKDVSNLSKDAFDYLHNTGVFQAKTPQEILDITGQGRLAKLNEIGLASYKASDDFDRAVGFMAVKNVLEEGLEGASNWGEMGAEYFRQHTKLYAAPQNIRDSVEELIFKGNLQEATHVYANWVNDMAFLNYSSIARPEAFNSFFGKMFGQMGTFATQTLSSRKYFLENLSKRDVAMYVGRAVLGGFALNSAFSELTGSEVNNFSSYKSMIFAGGPLVKTAYNITQLAGTDIQRGRAIGELGYSLKSTFTPLTTASNVYGGTQKILEGDIHSGLMQSLSFPGKGNFKDSEDDFLKYVGRL